jgi:hypothetical protein
MISRSVLEATLILAIIWTGQVGCERHTPGTTRASRVDGIHMVGQGLWDYSNWAGNLPSRNWVTADQGDAPLGSWRMRLVGFVQKPKVFPDFDAPWDSDQNAAFRGQATTQFDFEIDDVQVTIGAIWPQTLESKPVELIPGSTPLIVEWAHALPHWSAPGDPDFSNPNDRKKLSDVTGLTVPSFVLFANGSIIELRPETPLSVLFDAKPRNEPHIAAEYVVSRIP